MAESLSEAQDRMATAEAVAVDLIRERDEAEADRDKARYERDEEQAARIEALQAQLRLIEERDMLRADKAAWVANCNESESRLRTAETALREGVSVRVDGDKWGAVFPDFVDLQESISGWGDTAIEAVEELYREAVSA